MNDLRHAATGPHALTSAGGIPLADNAHSLTAGPRGPLLVQDWPLFEKHAHFNRERIPERVVHAKGYGAFGTFTVTRDLSEFTKAALFARVGQQTRMFARFSIVAGELGAADAERDVRGFAVKFYTEQGNWDLVGNNTPVFFVRDPYKFSDFIRTQKRDPRTHVRSPTAMWDFWSLSPESLHQVTILFSDRGLPRTLRHMNGYGSHTYSFINQEGVRTWVKFHFKCQQGIQTMPNAEAERIIGNDRESHLRDLVNAIDGGDFPRWTLMVQIMTESEAAGTPFDPFDLTKVWPHADYPLHEVGVMELNRVPDNYFADVEQSSFSPANVVPGIGHSPDKMLQFRIVSYPDAHRHRLGVNYEQVPVNQPIAPVHSYHRDGAMRVDRNGGGDVHYAPNSFSGPVPTPELGQPPLAVDGVAARYDYPQAMDDFTQPRALFRLMSSAQRRQLFENIAAAMQGVPDFIVERQIGLFTQVDAAYGDGVATALGRVGVAESTVPGVPRPPIAAGVQP